MSAAVPLRTVPGTPPATDDAVRATGLTRTYGSGPTAVHALAGVDVAFTRGAFTAIMGPSGSGKSTLMHCLAGLDTPSGGQVFLGDTPLTGMRDDQLTRLRRERIGFVFQSFNLLPVLDARENIVLPMQLAGRRPDPAWFDAVVARLGLRDDQLTTLRRQRIGFVFQAFNLLPVLDAMENIVLPMQLAGMRPDRAWLDAVIARLGLRERLGHRPHELSGGQQQRVAIARALLPRPDVVFADEPTGNLDSRSGAEVLGLLRSSVKETGQTVVMVTHDPSAAAYADRVVLLADGRLAGDLADPTAELVLGRMAEFAQHTGTGG